MHQDYSPPIETVPVGKGSYQEQGGFASWLGIISLYLGAVIIWILAMITRIIFNLM